MKTKTPAYIREKYGEEVDEIEWKDREYMVVVLDNGHWAYGYQISQVV